MVGLIDLHCHVLPGVDDGVRTLGEAVELARAAEADGVMAIAATPHVRDDYPTSAETMEAKVAEVNDAVREAGIGVEILRGGEVALDFLPELEGDGVFRFGSVAIRSCCCSSSRTTAGRSTSRTSSSACVRAAWCP